MQQVTLNFNVIGSCSQEIIMLVSDITPEELITGLNNGEYCTTMEYDTQGYNSRTICYFDEKGDPVNIATIISQTMLQETEYIHFQLENSDD